MDKIAFFFTGQGSQYEGMGKDLCDKYDEVKNIFDTAEEILEMNLKEICFNSSLEELSKTNNLQPSIFCISAGIYEILKNRGIYPSAVAGFSLGEITALYASEMLDLKSTLLLIKKRGEIMDAACSVTKGAMYSILGFDDEKLEQICKNVKGYVIPANFNSPSQTVISGEEDAANEVAKAAVEQGAKRAIKLNVAGGFHTELMNYKKEEFTEFLTSLNFSFPKYKFYSNLYGKELNIEKNINNFMCNYIPLQMSNPVKFKQEIEDLCSDENNRYENFVEIGVGKVLAGLVKKTAPSAKSIISLENCESVEKFLVSRRTYLEL